MTMLKSEHAKKRLGYYQGKVTQFQKQVEIWTAKHLEALKDEEGMRLGKMEGQLALNVPNCGTESGD